MPCLHKNEVLCITFSADLRSFLPWCLVCKKRNCELVLTAFKVATRHSCNRQPTLYDMSRKGFQRISRSIYQLPDIIYSRTLGNNASVEILKYKMFPTWRQNPWRKFYFENFIAQRQQLLSHKTKELFKKMKGQ